MIFRMGGGGTISKQNIHPWVEPYVSVLATSLGFPKFFQTFPLLLSLQCRISSKHVQCTATRVELLCFRPSGPSNCSAANVSERSYSRKSIQLISKASWMEFG